MCVCVCVCVCDSSLVNAHGTSYDFFLKVSCLREKPRTFFYLLDPDTKKLTRKLKKKKIIKKVVFNQTCINSLLPKYPS